MMKVRLEIKHGSVVKRWQSTAITPLGGSNLSSIELSGKIVSLESASKTRSDRSFFTTSKDKINGKICAYKSSNEWQADEALLFARSSRAQALLVVHKPNVVATIPIILVPCDACEFIESLPSPPSISAVPLNGSYKAIDVKLVAEQIGLNDSNPVEWPSKMFVPTTMLNETKLNLRNSFLVDASCCVFRDHNEKIDCIDPDYASILAGGVCAFYASHPDDANRAIELAMQHGAEALIIQGKHLPDYTQITLPVLTNVDSNTLTKLKRLGLSSSTSSLHLTIIYGDEDTTVVKEPNTQLVSPSKIDPPDSESPSDTKPDPLEKTGFIGAIKGAWSKTKTALGLYSPQLGKEFNKIIGGGTRWSFEGTTSSSFEKASKILKTVESKTDVGEKELEIEALIKAVVEMTENEDFVGDVLLLLFCERLAKLLHTKAGMGLPEKLQHAMCKVRD